MAKRAVKKQPASKKKKARATDLEVARELAHDLIPQLFGFLNAHSGEARDWDTIFGSVIFAVTLATQRLLSVQKPGGRSPLARDVALRLLSAEATLAAEQVMKAWDKKKPKKAPKKKR